MLPRELPLMLLVAAVGCGGEGAGDATVQDLSRARRLLGEERWEEAEATAVRASRSAPGSLAPVLLRAEALIGQLRYRAAAEVLEQAAALHGSDPALREARVHVLREQGRERAALALLADAPDDALVCYERGELHAHLGEWSAALTEFEDARASAPCWWPAAVGEAACLVEDGEAQVAAERLDAFLMRYGEEVEVLYQRALLAEARNEDAAALEFYLRGLRREPEHVPSLCNAALLEEKAGREESARALWERAYAALPEDEKTLRTRISRRLDSPGQAASR